MCRPQNAAVTGRKLLVQEPDLSDVDATVLLTADSGCSGLVVTCNAHCGRTPSRKRVSNSSVSLMTDRARSGASVTDEHGAAVVEAGDERGPVGREHERHDVARRRRVGELGVGGDAVDAEPC